MKCLILIFGWLLFVMFGGSVFVGLCATYASAWAVIPLFLALLCSPIIFGFPVLFWPEWWTGWKTEED